jgi:hypothetical protein
MADNIAPKCALMMRLFISLKTALTPKWMVIMMVCRAKGSLVGQGYSYGSQKF